jgi:hypothetical protein
MAKKRYVRKKNTSRRPGCFLWLLLLALAVGLALFWILRPASDAGAAPAGDMGWYTDDLGRIEDDKALVEGMAAFEKRTGVRPYLTILDGIAPDALDYFVQEEFASYFSSGDSLLVVYDEWGSDEYFLSAQAGAGSALSAEDVETVLACLEAAYADPSYKSYAQAFGAGFEQGAQRVSAPAKTGGAGLLLALGLLLLALSAVLVLFLRKKARTSARWDRVDG